MLTIGITTARHKPRLSWLFDSLALQDWKGFVGQIIIVDYFADDIDGWTKEDVRKRREMVMRVSGKHGMSELVKWTPVMPNVWGGRHRLTKAPWWHVSASRNSIVSLCTSSHVSFLDDRSLVSEQWIQCAKEAIAGQYVACGAYVKHHNLIVENGKVKDPGTVSGEDPRKKYVFEHRNGEAPTPCGGEWAFGANSTWPLEWILNINGYATMCDGLGLEDCIAGLQAANNGYPLKYDWRQNLIEDRTPGECGPVIRREDKGQSPHDRSHAVLNALKDQKTSLNDFNIRELRARILNGGSWPVPTQPDRDFWDGQLLRDMV